MAFSAADMSLAGIESRIPCDAMYKVGNDMPWTLRETSFGGLAMKETGKRMKEHLFCK
ncbi:hypothetical protein [Peribacillus simplex]|uniref:hypothetical protein n=1 Tax=Peribacillus simplex TaxID=1478 RepID=UPI0036DAE4B6